jgi:hypothetical protein
MATLLDEMRGLPIETLRIIGDLHSELSLLLFLFENPFFLFEFPIPFPLSIEKLREPSAQYVNDTNSADARLDFW